MAAINWDEIELLPRFDCCVCAAHAIPWGRTLDDRYFCSKGCCQAFEAGRHAVSRARGRTSFQRPDFVTIPGIPQAPEVRQDIAYRVAA